MHQEQIQGSSWNGSILNKSMCPLRERVQGMMGSPIFVFVATLILGFSGDSTDIHSPLPGKKIGVTRGCHWEVPTVSSCGSVGLGLIGTPPAPRMELPTLAPHPHSSTHTLNRREPAVRGKLTHRFCHWSQWSQPKSELSPAPHPSEVQLPKLWLVSPKWLAEGRIVFGKVVDDLVCHYLNLLSWPIAQAWVFPHTYNPGS